MRCLLALAGGLALLATCASGGPHTLNRPALRATAPRTLAPVRAKTPSFDVNSKSLVGGMFGIVGAIIAAGIESDIAEQTRTSNHPRDPAIGILVTVRDALAARFSLQVLPVSADSAPAAPADLRLEVATSRWGLEGTTGGYGVMYEGALKLIDQRRNEVIADGICSSHPVDGVSVDELTANHGERLREELDGVAAYCADDFRKRILGLY